MLVLKLGSAQGPGPTLLSPNRTTPNSLANTMNPRLADTDPICCQRTESRIQKRTEHSRVLPYHQSQGVLGIDQIAKYTGSFSLLSAKILEVGKP